MSRLILRFTLFCCAKSVLQSVAVIQYSLNFLWILKRWPTKYYTWSFRLYAFQAFQLLRFIRIDQSFELEPVLTRLFQSSYDKGIFPISWKADCVQPAHK